MGRRNLQSQLLLRVSRVQSRWYHGSLANLVFCTVSTAGVAMPRSTAVLAARPASVNVALDHPLRSVRPLRHPRTALEGMARLPRQLTRCHELGLLQPTSRPLLLPRDLALRLRKLHIQALSRRPLNSSQRNRLLLSTRHQPRLSLLTSQPRLLLLRLALLLHLLSPPRTHLPLLLTVVPYPLRPQVAAAVKARVDHTSRPSQAMAPRAPDGQARINGCPSRLCGRSTRTS